MFSAIIIITFNKECKGKMRRFFQAKFIFHGKKKKKKLEMSLEIIQNMVCQVQGLKLHIYIFI